MEETGGATAGEQKQHQNTAWGAGTRNRRETVTEGESKGEEVVVVEEKEEAGLEGQRRDGGRETQIPTQTQTHAGPSNKLEPRQPK
ncbi:uncharacterized protein ColSpa_01398 [Colletotrichum spaethianum]|uniref:Uncharacterized protein n=1 Tax=Colletotrichum spaethianum TaxID=700344 RepID=A0AA37LBB9_9PEZI|nr:uncharacterized protein ColSpa_01398 [Colletotrichum spaethianum]GKT41217.1 hypothetical protein ColSpa_01398 [Colletotrichum spaethianum]